jgi:putative hydrolase of the HAD superfamily
MKSIKLITFDLDDTFWDIKPVIIKAEKETREWIHNQVGEIDWGSMSDFLGYRKELIEDDASLEWDISLLRKKIYEKKLKDIILDDFKREQIISESYKIFMAKRHEVLFYDDVYDSINKLSSKYHLGVLTNGNADIYKFEVGKFFDFSISSLDVKSNKPDEPHFSKAIENYGDISYEEVLHIGDDQTNDVYGAHMLGINTLWFNRRNEEWNLDIPEPKQFCDWKNFLHLIEDEYESK